MGKGRDKKKKAAKKREDPNKPAPNKKQQQQSTKSAKRKARGGDGDDEEVEDIDSLLTAFQEDLKAAYKVTAEAEAPAPSRRANASLSVVPGSSGELILFGGEAFDGQRVAMFNDLYRILPDDAESSVKWMRVTSPNAPGPRSSHQAVIMPSGKLFLFGGEFVSPNETSFFHYKDFWSFDLATNEWEKLEVKGRPPPRSGHRMAAYKSLIVLFGGFYDTARETEYYDDLWVFDTLSYKWTQLELPDPKPSPRSGFQFFFDGDKSIHLYGGYCKIYTKGQKTRGLVHQDFWILRMGDGSPESLSSIRWERRRKAGGFVPSLRSGCTMVYYKSRAVLFGGVSDLEESEETIESVCHSDAYQYSLDNNKWFPLSVRPPKALAKARQNAAENSGLADIKPRAPGARFNSMMAVTKKTLYIYGGILEQGSKETTLSDMWCLNLDKPYEWKCLLEDDISAAEWLGEESDEEDEEDEEEEEEDDSSSSDTEQAEEQDELSEQIQSVSLDASDTDSDDEEFISSIPVPDPIPTENLREYFLRTSTDWQLRAIEWFEEQETQSLQQSGKGIKSLRRDAFTMAQSRYNKLLPELEAMRAKLKEEEAELEMATKKTKGKEQELGTSRHRDR